MFERKIQRNEWGDIVPQAIAGPRVGPVELCKAQWMLAARWHRKAAATCKRAAITFPEWLAIDALRELYQELHDAVSQNAVAKHSGLLRSNVSRLMPALEDKGLVSRGCSSSGRALRLFPTAQTEQLLSELYPHLEAISSQLEIPSNARAIFRRPP